MILYLKLLIVWLVILTQIFLPVNTRNRQDPSTIHLTQIGNFGLVRKARTGIPEHFHTGIDIMRPDKNYNSEPIYPIAKGVVISKRTDGPYANLIIEHKIEGLKFWSLYEHIGGIRVHVNDMVNPEIPIARFLNKDELTTFGWQFDHFHLEILKKEPVKTRPDKIHPERFFNSYSLVCYTEKDLDNYYFNPIKFFNSVMTEL